MKELSKRESNKLQRRAAILSAAQELFSENGFKGTTVQEVSERAGLSKGTVYLYFKSKEELYLSACISGIAGFGERLVEAVSSARRLEDRIKAVYIAYIRYSLEEPAVFRVLRDTFLEKVRQNLSSKTIEETSSIIKGWLENESRLVQEGIDSGMLDADLDPYTFSIAAWRMATGLVELALLQDPIVVDPEDMQRVYEESIDLLIKGSRSAR
ncbi:MAG: TetR/AcrR family transcriptional regulator [Actinobacteria bacterium]|nr:TetR/AcrR family transcriptional regulator [Actinomycetota bacterium]